MKSIYGPDGLDEKGWERAMNPPPHRHRKVPGSTTVRAFRGPIPGAKQNPAAHGNVEYTDRCSCGATRHTNVNQHHEERGPWVKP